VVMVGFYDYRLVALSVAIAILASYTALDLGGRVAASRGWARYLWLAGGATSMGAGIWSLHFVAMLAFTLPIPVQYDWPTVFLSLLAGIFASAVALFVVSRQTMGPLRVLAGGILMGGGIATLHYTGMAAMRLPAMCRYSPALVTLSVLLAIAGSLISLWLTFHFRDEPARRTLRKAASAMLMGAAIGSMHYTAMAAASFTPSAMVPDLSHTVSVSFLGATGISAVSGMVLVLTLFTCLVDRLQEKKTLLDELFEQAPQAVALTTADVRVVRVNREFTRLFGYTPQEALGRRLSELIVPDEWRDEDRRYMDLVAHRHRVDAEGVRRCKEGSRLHVAMTYVPFLASSGDAAVYAIYRDITERQRAYEALRASESRWRTIFENSGVGIAMADRQGKFIAANRAYREMVGYTDEELRGMSFMDLTYEEDRALCAVLAQELWDGSRQQVRIEKRYWRKDGKLIWVRHTVSKSPGAETAPPCTMAVMEDITERKLGEEALRESKMRLELSLKASNMGLWDWNIGTNEVYVSPLGKSQLDYADYEIGNRAEEWETRVHPEDRERVLAAVRAFLESPSPRFETECRVRLRDGSYRWVLTWASVLRDANGKPYRMLGAHLDITERKRTEERLREYEKVVENLQEMIMVVDRDYRYLIANRAFLNYRSLERDQVVGRLVSDVLDKEVFDKVVKQKVDECLQGNIVHYELRYNYPRFGERDLFISYFPIQGPAGIDRVACVLEDITEPKRAEKELQRSLAQLRKLAARLETVREEERTRAAREIHDELGQALTAIKLDLTALLRDLPPDQGPAAQRRQSILKLLEQAMRSTRRIATELRPAVLDDLGLAAAVEWAAEDFQARTGIKCQASLPEGAIALDSERATALFRILQESLTNVARHASASQVTVRLGKGNGGFLLEVHDNGRGFDEKLFSTANSLGILGMRERALLLGGELTIDAAPGEGTTVRVRIPEAWRKTAGTSK